MRVAHAALLASLALTPLLLPPRLPAQLGWLFGRESFKPKHTLNGVGAGREELSQTVLARRAEMMIDSQTFSIIRDPRSLAGAQRVTGPGLKKIFEEASRVSGLPASYIAAVAYLESWGEANAQSPAGPKGIMQIAGGTAKSMGLQVRYATRYRTAVVPVTVKRKGKKVTVKRRKRIPYSVVVGDDRLVPTKAVPAAAKYLARMEQKFGGRDWAIWAYHCGEGCVAEVRSIAQRTGVKDPMTVASVFFGAHPGLRRELHNAIQHHMDRDFSPTYYFRIRRAEELLKLYEESPAEFRRIYEEYRNRVNPAQRAPHRLAVWLKPEDLAYQTCEDMRRESGRNLVRAFDNPEYYGFTLAKGIGAGDPANRDFYLQGSTSAVGAIAYIAYETRRLHEAMKPKGEKFAPLEVTALVKPREEEERMLNGKGELPSHCSGQVFDISHRNLPPGQREALEFVLEDLGWYGYVGFVRDSDGAFHVGPAPSARDFFAQVYQDAMEKVRASD